MKSGRIRWTTSIGGVLGAIAVLVVLSVPDRPRVLAVNEVPVAFWAWRTETPKDAEVRTVFTATNAKVLFLRAGQFDLIDGKLSRIRPVTGKFPKTPELHLVYNGTRGILSEFERIETSRLAGEVADTYRLDLSRASNKNVGVTGLQLDLDVPTRLLPRYAELLRRVRELLPPDTALSVTGLPTWADSNDLQLVLEAVDFWIPQCYGARIPTSITERIPISSAIEVERTISKVRRLEKPFYAGLSAYGYAILYGRDGNLIELRGDIALSDVSGQKEMEPAATRTFRVDGKASEVRQEYRAKRDVVIDGLIIRAGETLVFDLPTAASLRASARAVRENAGGALLGICLFRIPTERDNTTLSIKEISAALDDREAELSARIKLETRRDRQLLITVENSGEVNADSISIDLAVPVGSVNGIYGMSGFQDYQTLCGIADNTPSPCSDRRANLIRLTAGPWPPNASAWSALSTTKELPNSVTATITTRTTDGSTVQKIQEIKMQDRGEEK